MRPVRRAGILALAAASSSAYAELDRSGTWEVGGTLLDFASVDVTGIRGSSIAVDDDTGFGFAGAYNFTDRLALGLDIVVADPGYEATLIPDDGGQAQIVRANLDVEVIHFKGIFNLLDREVTPYIELGAGWTYVDTNIVSGIAGPVCWWDPWWGFICRNYYTTYDDTRRSTTWAIGVRWDINPNFVFRAGWGSLKLYTNRASEYIETDSAQLTFAFRF